MTPAERQLAALKMLTSHFTGRGTVKDQWDAVPVMARVEIVRTAKDAVAGSGGAP